MSDHRIIWVSPLAEGWAVFCVGLEPLIFRSGGGAQPMDATNPAEVTDQNEDLEIPSFLRRLAN